MDAIRALILSPMFGGPPYVAFGLILLGICVGFPFSSDITMLTGGVLAGAGIFDLLKAIPIAYCSILFGDSVTFFIGRKFGHQIVKSRFFQRICSPERFEEISGFLNKNASKFIFSIRFTMAARCVSFLIAGTVGVNPKTFFKMNGLSTALWVPSIMTLGFYATNQAEALVSQFRTYKQSMTLVLVASILGYILYRRRVAMAARVKSEPVTQDLSA